MFKDWFKTQFKIYAINNTKNNIGETKTTLIYSGKDYGLFINKKNFVYNSRGIEEDNDLVLFTTRNLNITNLIEYSEEFYKILNKRIIKDYWGDFEFYRYELKKWK